MELADMQQAESARKGKINGGAKALSMIALGRTIGIEWQTKFMRIFREHVPETVTAQMRKDPGVVHAPPSGIKKLPGYKLLHRPSGGSDREASLKAALALLYNTGVLGEESKEPSPPTFLKYLELKKMGDGTFNLRANFADVRAPTKPDDRGPRYLMFDERAAIWEANGETSIAPTLTPGTVPIVGAILCNLSIREGDIHDVPIGQLTADLLSTAVILNPVGVVHTQPYTKF